MDIPNSTTTKRCTKCGVEYPSTTNYFSISNGKLRSYCRQCAHDYNVAYYEKHADAMRERSRAYHQEHDHEHRQEKRSYDQVYRRENAERRRQYTAEFRKNYPEYMAKWRADNAERLQAWRKSDEGHKASGVIAHRRRARKLSAGGSFTAADIEAIRTAQGNRCYLCGDRLKKFHIDHFIPLALGGTNEPGNLRLACPKCNLSKGAKHPHDMGRLI